MSTPSKTRDNFLLEPCTPADVEGMLSVYLAAFAPDYFSSFTFPATIAPAERQGWARARFLKTFSTPEIHNLKISDTSVTPPRIVAWARWGFPHVLDAAEKERRRAEKELADAAGSAWPRGANLEICDLKFGGIHAARERNVDWERDYIVHLLQTHPEYQKKGLARWLLDDVLERVDVEGRRCHIEATKDGLPLYRKLGFRETEVIEVDLRRWGGDRTGKNWVMVREPRGKEEEKSG